MLRRLTLTALIVLVAGMVAVEASEMATRTIPDFLLAYAGGGQHTRAEWKDRKAVVLFFLATECPISNGYAPEYVRLAKAFGERGVAFLGVQSDPDVTAADQVKHAKEYGLPFPILM